LDERINISYEFGSFRLVPEERQLLRDGQPVSLPPKAFDTLVILVQHSGHALKKNDLIKQVWPDSFVEESNLNHYISVLRKALGEENNANGYVETVRGYGFRFKADVRASTEEHSSLLVHRRTRTHVVVKEEESESFKTVGIVHTAAGGNTPGTGARRAVLAVTLLIAIGGLTAAYFGYLRPAQSRSAGSAHSVLPATRKRPVENPAAREAYLRGRYFWNMRTPDDIMKAGFEFRRALQIDPSYAPAYVGLADCLLLGGTDIAATDNAKTLALKAIALDDQLAAAHATLAYYKGAVEWNWVEAENEFEKSIALDPTYPTARHWHAYNLASLGRIDDAIAEIRKARELDPLSIIISTDVGHILYLAQRYDEAIAQYFTALQMNPDFRVARWRLGEAYVQIHRYDEAVTELQKAISLESGRTSALELWIAHAAAVNGHKQDALKTLSRRQVDAEARGHTYAIALVYAGLGDKDSTFAWLEKAFQLRDGNLALIKVEPMLKGVRNDPRYADLLRRINLPTG